MSTPSTGELLQIAAEVEDNLHRQVLAQWFPRAVDPAGGFHQNYAEDWSRLPGDDRSVVYQSRLTWLAAQAAQRFPHHSPGYLNDARHGFYCLRDRLWDTKNGGFFWAVDGAGEPARGGEKHVYGVSFAIYALAALYHASKDGAVLSLAQAAFGWLQAHAHDTVNGGWHESLSRTNVPILAPAGGGGSDALGTRQGCKSMNTHIHLLESLAALCEARPSQPLREALLEVFLVVRDKVAVESAGYLNLFFTPDWKVQPDHDSYGHDVETAFLLVEGSAVLGLPHDPRTWALARRIVDHALGFGWDTKNGGFYDSGGASGPILDRNKIWWVQAEGLNALLLMDSKFGRETGHYWDAFLRQWRFIQNHQTDPKHGGWLSEVAENGDTLLGRVKSDSWTEGYHQGRALLTVSATLRKMASRSNETRQKG